MEEREMIGVLVSRKLKRTIEKALKMDAKLTISEFVRASIEEYLQRHYPTLMKEFHGEEGRG
ncbi:MAG: hypothetical protein QW356_05485 [Candidatus Hadarchaeales archaeon]